VLEALVAKIDADQECWLNGDSGPYEFLDERSTILGPFGGAAIGASVSTPGQRRAVAQFESGSGTIEVINHGISGDTAWVVMIERCTVKFAGQDAPRRWDLRVNEAFERQAGTWVRVHRHADPLVDRRPLDEVLPLLD
jgi:hypothetical protein